jgi:transposase-like protein
LRGCVRNARKKIKSAHKNHANNEARARISRKAAVMGADIAAHSEPANKTVSCLSCNRSFRSRKALYMHLQSSSRHSKTDRTTQGARSQIQTTVSTIPTVTLPDSAATNLTFAEERGRHWCSVCHRQLQTENGYRKHLETSKEHKANLRQLSNMRSAEKNVSSQLVELGQSKKTAGFCHQPAMAYTMSKDSVDPLHIAQNPISKGHRSHTDSFRVPGKGCRNVGKPGPEISHSWSEIPIPIQQRVFETLKRKCHGRGLLLKNGYRLQQGTDHEIDGRRKCWNCRRKH